MQTHTHTITREKKTEQSQIKMTTTAVSTFIGTHPTNERKAIVHSRTVNYKNNHNKWCILSLLPFKFYILTTYYDIYMCAAYINK